MVDSVWEFREGIEENMMAAATVFWDAVETREPGPDLFACLGPFPKSTQENAARFGLPENN